MGLIQTIESTKIRKLTVLLRVFSNKRNRTILDLIEKRGLICVSDIEREIGIEQSITSQYLAKLRAANLVLTSRDGKKILYSVNNETIRTLVEMGKMVK